MKTVKGAEKMKGKKEEEWGWLAEEKDKSSLKIKLCNSRDIYYVKLLINSDLLRNSLNGLYLINFIVSGKCYRKWELTFLKCYRKNAWTLLGC